jgi:hypothetical protein
LDVGPFSPLSNSYSRTVQEYTPTGMVTLNWKTFVQIYVKARQAAFTERNIRAGWKRTGILPLNPQRILDDPAVKNFGRTTPETQPPPAREGPNHLLATPKMLEEFEALSSTIGAKLSPLTQRKLERITHGAVQEYTQAHLLRATQPFCC